METVEMHETDPALLAALRTEVAAVFGRDTIQVEALNTGGGCMVAAVDLSIDGRFMGRQVWLTREDDWYLGFYDFHADDEDPGVVVSLMLSEAQMDDPIAVAREVAGALARLGVNTLQGE